MREDRLQAHVDEGISVARSAESRTLGQSDLGGIVAQDKTSLLWGPGFHAVTYPLPHRRQMNIALFMKAREQDVLGDNPPRAPKLPWSATGNRRFASK